MMSAILYGFLSGFALLLGAVAGLRFKLPKTVIALIMAYGSGVLMSALSIDLMNDAFEISEDVAIISISFVLGAVVFVLGDAFIDSQGGDKRKSIHPPNEVAASAGKAILLGTLLDGVPESLVMGTTLTAGETGGIVMVVAVFLSNFPEGISGTIAMKNSGMSKAKILGIWSLMLLITMVCTAFGYRFLGDASAAFKAASMAFASGAILAMLCDTMLPEAYKDGGKFVGVVSVLGFLTAFLLSKLWG